MNNCYYYTILDSRATHHLVLRGRINCIAPKNVHIGNYCIINDKVIMHARGGITLWDHVTISTGAKIISRGYKTNNWREECASNKSDKNHFESEIYLGDHTWVGGCRNNLTGRQNHG